MIQNAPAPVGSPLPPKTLAALYPERVALPAAVVYYPLLFVCYPIVWFVNAIANGLLRLVGPGNQWQAFHNAGIERVLARYNREPEQNFPGTGGELAHHLLNPGVEPPGSFLNLRSNALLGVNPYLRGPKRMIITISL